MAWPRPERYQFAVMPSPQALRTLLRGIRPCLALLACAATAAAAAPPDTAPAGVALVVGNATYPGLPALQSCLTSAHSVAAALRRLNFSVVEQEDASEGYLDGALAQFAQQVRQADHPPTVIYVCAYASAFNGRPFLVPVSANVTRPADLLTQAVLARSVANAGAQANAGPSLSVIDVVPMPGAPAELGLASLTQGLPPQLGIVAATDQANRLLPTPVATALAAALGGPLPVTVDGVAQAVQHAPGTQIAAAQVPAVAGALAGAPPVARAPVPAAARPAAVPAAAKPAAAAPAAAAPAGAAPAAVAPAAAPPGSSAAAAGSHLVHMPDEDQMTEADRRQVQIGLARLGYYDGRIDGVFGPDTRAAIRRYQFELHATMTGQLTAAEASRLVSP